MFKVLFALIIAVLLIVFSMQNMEHAEIQVVTGQPLSVPLILIIAVSFLVGYAFALVSFLFGSAGRKRRQLKAENTRRSESPSRAMRINERGKQAGQSTTKPFSVKPAAAKSSSAK